MFGLSLARVAFATIVCGIATGCSSSSTSSQVGPSDVRCALTVSPAPPPMSSTGGTGNLNLSINRECTWSAKPEVDWIAVTPASGQGDAQINYTVASNPLALERKGTILVNERRVELTQRAACIATLAPKSGEISASGGRLVVSVSTAADCPWTAVSQVGWISIVAGSPGNGAGSATLEVDANAGVERTGSVRIAGLTFTVTQRQPGAPPGPAPPEPPAPQPGCTFSLSSGSQAIGSSGGSGSVSILTTAGCAWTATTGASWLTIESAPAGTGPAAVQFSAGANTAATARTGTLTIAGITFTVTQAASTAACTYSVSSTSQSVGAAGGSGSITVSAASGCAWTATSHATWLTISSGASGSGSGTVQYSAAANSSTSPRTGTLTIATRTVTITQAASPTTVTVSGAISGLQGQCPAITFVVGGRTVRTTASTDFRRGSCNSLNEGDTVTVEGLMQANGSIAAAWVSKD